MTALSIRGSDWHSSWNTFVIYLIFVIRSDRMLPRVKNNCCFCLMSTSQYSIPYTCNLFQEYPVEEAVANPSWCVICLVLFLIQGSATSWTYFPHLSLSSVILIDSATESLVHVMMWSIQAVHGFPRFHTPGIVPYIITFSRQLPCFLLVWP